MENIREAFGKFLDYQLRLSNLYHATNLLHWDMSTIMPPKDAERRSEVVGFMSQEAFRIETDKAFIELTDSLFEVRDELSDQEKAMVEKQKKEQDFKKKIPEEEYLEYSILVSRGEKIWEDARNADDYEAFRPTLEKIVQFNRKIADYIGWEETRYDALLDLYEPGMKVSDIDKVFSEVRDGLVSILDRIRAKGSEVDDSFLHDKFDKRLQEEYNRELAERLGFDFEAGVIAVSAHPFTTNFGNKDVRITTRYDENDLMMSVYSTIHEAGHAIYEQNIPDELAKTNIGGGVSMGIHESQSRFYENIVGRSRGFIGAELPKLAERFPNLSKVSPDEFHKAVNKVMPSLIRIEADELTYSLHIIIRYEIEKAFINGEVDFNELPKLWSAKYREYLGVEPANFREGVLQDVHWAGGMIGYFPSYALGNLYGAQMLYKGILRDLPDYNEIVASGDLRRITGWLKDNIHIHGGTYKPSVLIEKATGEALSASYFLRYIEEKYSKLYGI